MRKFLFFVFAVLYIQCWGQGNMITINSTVPSQMTICGPAKAFTISVYNPSPFTLTNDTLKLIMPPGIVYQTGSIVGTGVTEFNITIPNQPVFLLPAIPTLTYLNISFTAAATCDIMPFLAGGGIVENSVRINYLANGSNTFDQHTTASYIVRQPNLSISNFTNQSYTGAIGDVFSRCITVTNGGFGELSQFTLTDNHGSGLQITNVSNGTWVNTGTTETITLTGAHFATIGDGDSLFENGESIVICETVNILNCISVASAFEAYWGCNTQNCQSSTSNANVVFPNLIPNLVLTPIASMNSCLGAGNASAQQLRIVNTGLGTAVNVQLDVFQQGGGSNPHIGSNIDTSSFTVQTGLGGPPSPLSPTNSVSIQAQGCMTAPQGRAYLNIPSINPGDTIYIKWNSYTCCYNACTNVGDYDINGWRYKGTYENICQTTYVITEAWGRVYSRLRVGVNNNGSPSTLTEGETGTFNFLFSTYENNNSYPVGPGAYWKFEITVPPCLVYNPGTFLLTRSNGIHTWAPASVTATGTTIVAIFNGAPPWSLLQSQVTFDATVNCASCGGSNNGAVSIKVSYVPNNTCPCEVVSSCQNTAISVICPGPCPEGMLFRNFQMKRTSYGLPDNEVGGGNGIPDPGGSLDFTKIKTDRAMFGDTISCSFNGVVKTSLAYPSWQYCYATSSISNGNRLTFLDATLSIYRGGALLHTCNSFTPTITNTGSTRYFKYDLSVASLPCLSGYVYLNDDSVVFKPRYRVSSNIGNATPINCYSTNEYYMSDIPNPGSSANKFQCANYNGNCTIIGYYYSNHGDDSYNVKSCNNVTISQNYYLSIGPCCNNYAGGNLFPYEYRNWAHMSILTAIVPPGYDFISAQFNQVRTSGTIVSTTNPTPPAWQAITPVNPNSDTLKFLVEPYFEGYGGSIPLSDDGFHGTLQVVLRPSCEVTPAVEQPIKHDWTFAPTPFLTGPGSASTNFVVIQDSITYEAPFLFLQSTLPSINAPNLLASWEVSISNLSNTSNALNTWLSGPVMSGINITEVYDLDNSTVILPVGEIYQVGTVNAGAVRNFRITAGFTSCLKDSVIIYNGWNCNGGYPSTVQTYPCTPKTIKLSLTPLMPALVVNVTAPPSTIQLCDTASYIAEGVNVQLGTAYQVTLKAVLPAGVDIVPGSSEFSYPITDPYITISDPSFIGGTTWQWDISLADTTIGLNGLKGIVENTLNKFKLTFKVITNCGYTSGSTIAFNLQGNAACGMPTGQEVALSSKLGITGATPPYSTAISLLTNYISPCANNSLMHVVIDNLGPQAFNTTDSIYLQLPVGVTYVAGSYTGIHNAPSPGTPVQYMLNGRQFLGWKLPTGVVAGDSTVFDFSYQGDAETLSCAISEFEGRSTSSTNVVCTQSGVNCGINIATGDTTLSVFTYKAYLSLSNGQAVSVLNAPSGETVSVSLDIANTGEAISNGASSILEFYYDFNGNGIYNTGDVFIMQDTLQVNNNSVFTYTNTINVPAGNACAIIATVRDAINPCVCNPSQLLLVPVLTVSGNDTTVCSGELVTLGHPAVTGYIYSWSPAAGLNNASSSSPVLTTSNLNTTPESTPYILTINRLGCIFKDTVDITVKPLPVSDAGPDIIVCAVNSIDTLGTNLTAGYSYSWSPANGLSSASVSDPSISLGNADTTTFVVTATLLGCSTSDSVLVRINPVPTAQMTGSTVVCVNAPAPLVTFEGGNATPPYTFTYSLNGSVQTISTTSGNSVSIQVPTTAADTFTYILTGVQESSSTSCTKSVSDTVIVIVNPLPAASVAGTVVVCQSDTSPHITFTGAGGTQPYTFTYKINNSLPLIVSTTSGNSVDVLASTAIPGSYNYILLSVQDGSSSACQQAQPDTATVTVNPTPSGTISGSTAVCRNSLAPDITFSGSGGTSPYTFTYSINLVPQPPVTSTGNTVTVSVPTSVAGSFTYLLSAVQDNSPTACTKIMNDSVVIIVNPLPTATISGSASVCKNDTFPVITFTGANGTPPYTFNYTLNGTPQTLSSSIGSSTATIAVPTTSVNTFVYKLVSVQDGSSTTCSQAQTDSVIVTINPLPVAIYSPTEVCFNTPVQFTDQSTVSSGSITAWSWAFGDEATSVLQSPFYTYSGFGNYTATLVVTTNNGCKDTASEMVVVHPLPSPAFTAANVCEGTITTFNEQSTIVSPDAIQSWSWNFGDNTSLTTQQPVHLYTATGAYAVELIVTSTFGCKDSVTHTVLVHPNPVIAFTASQTTGCEPLCVFFQDISQIQSGMNANWLWDTGDGSPAGATSEFQHCFGNDQVSLATTYDVTLTVISDSGCTSTLTKTNYITIYPKPEADFIAQPLTTTILNPVVTVSDSSLGATTWLWDFDDGTTAAVYNPPAHEYADTGHYVVSLIVTSQYGCKDTAEQLVVIEADFAFYVPNAFTPNDDGVNDSFSGKGVFIMEYEMMIFDRWGNLVYQTDDIKKPWDGKANGGDDIAQRDVYVYVIKVTDIMGNKHKYRGTVTLVK